MSSGHVRIGEHPLSRGTGLVAEPFNGQMELVQGVSLQGHVVGIHQGNSLLLKGGKLKSMRLQLGRHQLLEGPRGLGMEALRVLLHGHGSHHLPPRLGFQGGCPLGGKRRRRLRLERCRLPLLS